MSSLVKQNRNEEPNALKPAKNYYLFVVAVDYYEKNKDDKPNHPTLNNPVRDADNLISLLTEKYVFSKPLNSGDLRVQDKENYGKEEKEIFIYDDLKLTCFYNQNAKKKNIITHFKKIFNTMDENDAFLFYFSGHGSNVNKTGYILPFDAQKDEDERLGWVSYDDLYQYINTAPKRCRDVLFILDCCYSGAINYKTPNLPLQEQLSRYVMTSCNYNQEALDGLKDIKGSPFSVALLNVLTKPKYPTFVISNILEDIRNAFKFQIERVNIDFQQEITYKELPVDFIGDGEFVFALKEQDKPPLSHLTDTFETHLDFKEQKGKLEDAFNPNNAHFNIIATCGNSANGQKLLTKILFKMLAAQIPENAPKPYIVDIGSNFSGDIIWHIAKSIMGNRGHETPANAPFSDTIEGLSKWIYEKTSEMDTPSVFRLLLRVNFGDKKLFSDIENFCCTLKDKFAALVAQLPLNEQPTFGKLFIVLSDERQAEQGFTDDFSAKISDTANVIIMQKVKNINTNHVSAWVTAAKDAIKTKKFKTIEEKNLRPIGKENLTFYDYSIDDFTERVCNYCSFDIHEITTLHTLLYDFQH